MPLASLLAAAGMPYLVTFPDWYQNLTSGLSPAFTAGEYPPASGEHNLTVYRRAGL